mgnify:CR=1 FL=1
MRFRSRSHASSFTSPRASINIGFSLMVLLIVILGGGVVVLGTWDIPAPTATTEKVLPDERFPR